MANRPGKIATVLINFLKLGVAAALIFWMVHSGRLDLRVIERAGSQWPKLCAIAAVFYFQIFILSLRWRLLARALDLGLSRNNSFSLTMTGMLFNTVIPGSVGGDVLKAYYARGASAEKSGAVASIIVDRVVGLFSLVLLAVFGAAWNFRQLSRNADLRAFWIALGAILLIAAATGIAAMAASEGLSSLLTPPGILSPVRGMLLKTLGVLSSYNRKRGVLLQSVALSIPCHLLACGAFYLSWLAISAATLDPGALLFVVPLGLVTTAVPLAPAGIGVGQAAFFTLFQFVLQDKGSVGSSAFTVFQMVLLLVSCSGVVFYLRVRKIVIPQVAFADEAAK
jgi:uncharacterized protein (TIRG00374 family)